MVIYSYLDKIAPAFARINIESRFDDQTIIIT